MVNKKGVAAVVIKKDLRLDLGSDRGVLIDNKVPEQRLPFPMPLAPP
jgi:hypothetical protein